MKMLVNSVIDSNNKINNIPCKICYIGYNFSVRILHELFSFRNCIMNEQLSGVFHTDFTPLRELLDMRLSVDATKMQTLRNAGGSSKKSEIFSLELLGRCYNAKLIKTEVQIEYFPYGGKNTDYMCKVFDTLIGISVTRARSYLLDAAEELKKMKHSGKLISQRKLRGRPFSLDDAKRLLKKKLKGINEANRNSLENWTKQILHVWSDGNDISDKLEQAFHLLEPELVSNTVLLITTTTGTACDFIYMNRGVREDDRTRSPGTRKR